MHDHVMLKGCLKISIDISLKTLTGLINSENLVFQKSKFYFIYNFANIKQTRKLANF